MDCKPSIDWTLYSSVQMEAMTSDVIAPSPWKIFGCQNGETRIPHLHSFN